MEWLLWFRDTQKPTRARARAFTMLRAELTALGMTPIGSLLTVFPAERKLGQWVIRVSILGSCTHLDMAGAADQAGRRAGFRLEYLPQQESPAVRR